MAEVRWTPQAVDNLESIADFIAKDSSHYARLFIMDILVSVDRLYHFPKSGRVVPELKNPAIREIILGNYRIVYRLKSQTVEILTVYHGAKLLQFGKFKPNR
jgi:plasmid stabilization system protein ParE